jgi:hypothetical protein
MLELIQLVAPNGHPIAGFRAKDGSTLRFKYRYDRSSAVGVFVFEDGSPASESSGTLVDSEGNAWDSSEVVYYTLFTHRG